MNTITDTKCYCVGLTQMFLKVCKCCTKKGNIKILLEIIH